MFPRRNRRMLCEHITGKDHPRLMYGAQSKSSSIHTYSITCLTIRAAGTIGICHNQSPPFAIRRTLPEQEWAGYYYVVYIWNAGATWGRA